MTLEDLPFIDRHRVTVQAPAGVVWDALLARLYARRRFMERRPGRYLVRLLKGRAMEPVDEREDLEHVSGLPVERHCRPRELILAGSHRFARYRMEFQIDDSGDGNTSLSMDTYASFPGIVSSVYRFIVIRSGLHKLAVRRMLRDMKHQAENAD